MPNVLEKICADRTLDIAELKQQKPLASFIDELTPSDRSFYDALAKPEAGYILECKKASPSKGLIREPFELDEIIAAYAPYASCISVLTEHKYFQGKFEYLPYVRDRLTQPVLNKDFFVDPYQVYLARHYRADGILLMLSVLTDAQYQEMAEIAESLSLDVLTEVSNEEEADRAVKLGAKIIGINNRDLRDLSTNLATTEALAPKIKAAAPDALVISESGIYTQQDVRRLAPLADGFLVGSSLMSQKNVSLAVKQLLFGTVKICGITNIDDAQTVAASPASFAGLIFAEQSKRAISLTQAAEIVAAVPQQYVSVFVNAAVNVVAHAAETLGLTAVQLHGSEDQAYIDALRPLLPADCQIWQAKGVTDSLPELNAQGVDCVLLDCKVGNQSGGTGQTFDWQLLAKISDKSQLALAGGLSPDNIQTAAGLGMGLLDVNSGVETAPGQKSAEKIAQLFTLLRQY